MADDVIDSTAVTVRPDSQAVVFNPLDAEPVSFAKQLATRQENYDQLALHLRGMLIPDKDFGRIHVKKDCDNKWSCTNEYHFSGYELFAPGADKILGVLGLGVEYPGLEDYKRAAMKGMPLEDIIIDAHVVGVGGQQIASGMGACSRSEIAGGNLNNTVKRACKRARVDAVKRLPAISALFEDDFLAQVARDAARGKQRSTTERAQKVKNLWDTGADLLVCPIGQTGGKMRDKRWAEIDTDALEWLVANVTDKPDIHRAAAKELAIRHRAQRAGGETQHASSPPDLEE